MTTLPVIARSVSDAANWGTPVRFSIMEARKDGRLNDFKDYVCMAALF